MRFGPGLRLDTPSPPRKYRRIVLRDRPVVRDRPRMLPPCFFKTTNSICSSDFSIGSSLTEEPPKAVGQIHHAEGVSFPLPVTVSGPRTPRPVRPWSPLDDLKSVPNFSGAPAQQAGVWGGLSISLGRPEGS